MPHKTNPDRIRMTDFRQRRLIFGHQARLGSPSLSGKS